MTMNKPSSILTTFTFIILLLCAIFELGFCREFGIVKNFNGVDDHKSSPSEIESIARFAVVEHNKRENALLQFERVLKAKEEVVVGKIYHLTLVVYDAGKITKAVYEAKVWVKPWMNFKQLQEFKNVIDMFESARSAHETLPDGLGSRKVAKVHVHDPQIQAAANHAVAAINQRINCEVKYELVEILQAQAEVVEDCLVRYEIDMLLKPKIESGNDKAQI